MKTIPPSSPAPETGPKYWRSLDHLADTPEFRAWAEREFPAGASELTDPVTRRSFVKLMSASFLLAGFGMTGCRRPVERIYPFSKMPENYVHGAPKYYATAMPSRGSAVPLVVKSSDGRPTKIEGNSLHPDSNGGTDRFTQACILDLYDPDRAMRITKDGTNATPAAAQDFLDKLAVSAQASHGAGLAFLAGQSSSPSRARLQKLIADKYPQSTWHVYEPVDFDIHRKAATMAFGQAVAPYFKIDKASVILSLDSDFIGGEENLHVNIRQFANGRRTTKPEDPVSRLYAVEGMMTLTGMNADHRLRIASSLVPAIAARLAQEITGSSAAQSPDIAAHEKWIVECAKDLLANKGKSLVLAGHRQPLGVHLIVNAINSALGNINETISLLPAAEPTTGSFADLASALNAGKVETLIILGGNPVYDAPADLNWAAAQARAKTLVRLAYYEDESFSTKGWNFPLAHFLESWGDAHTSDGTLVPIQPLIEPLFGGWTELEVLSRIAGEAKAGYEVVRETFQTIASHDEEVWKKFLHDGFLADSAAKPVSAQLSASAVSSAGLPAVSAPAKDKLEVVFHRDYRVDDGRYNNNGWLQELPDPVTKVTWENVVLMSIKTAQDLGLKVENLENNRIHAPVVKVKLDGREIEGPAWTQPGMADNVIALAVGYGRKQTGRVGKGSGFNAYSLRTAKTGDIAVGATVTGTGTTHPLALTQDHWIMEGRPVVREATVEEYRGKPEFGHAFDLPEPEVTMDEKDKYSLYPNPLFAAEKKAHHQWGMSIDLSTCVGCSSCMMACQSENNIPIVGKYQVANHREMHWIRIDRYFTGDPADPQVVNQPMLCQHCEAAPCENVCPVNATSHDQEGLNVMTYNRCVGTRYCSNNCPYKVRRFNFFDYNRRTLEQLNGPVYPTPLLHSTDGEWDMLRWWKDPDRGTQPSDQWELLKLVKNPDVSVRMRGVMEKCSYCLQRIEQAKIAQKVKAGASGDVVVPDGVIKTACQQACPAEAIVFGNVADPNSRVSILKKQGRDYQVLDSLNTKPRTTYLARIRNPNPAMPDAYSTPNSTEEFEKANHERPFENGDHGHAALSTAAAAKGAI